MAASIADECPARPEGRTQKVGQVCGAIEPLFATSGTQSVGEYRKIHDAHELDFDIGLQTGEESPQGQILINLPADSVTSNCVAGGLR